MKYESSDGIFTLCLHDHLEYINDCVVLINKQWKRSECARMQSIEKSFEDLPDSLLLLEKVDGKMHVIGHSRLTRVLEDPNGCWIGSVVIAEEKRGMGYGKYLMRKTEEHAKLFNFSTVYLNTKDKQGFYEHLGYTYCEPVSMVASKFNPLLLAPLQNRSLHTSQTIPKKDSPNTSKSSEQEKNNSTILPPPPPPMPQKKLTGTNNFISNLGQFWMKKAL